MIKWIKQLFCLHDKNFIYTVNGNGYVWCHKCGKKWK